MTPAPRRASARLALTGALVAAAATALAPSAAGAASTERLKLDARTGMHPVSTRKPLKRGTKYIVTAKGTFAYYAASAWRVRPPCGTAVRPMYRSPGVRNTLAGNDAEFTFALPGRDSGCGNLPYKFINFQMATTRRFMNTLPIGGQPIAPDAKHRYRYLLEGKGRQARFRLRDKYTGDNYGILRISIRPAPKGFTAPLPAPAPTPAPTPAAP